ncbi:MAG: DTW domain-containing protein YfiP [Enterobacterales bacterium]|jgi:DTW domain-containing protein YfiP
MPRQVCSTCKRPPSVCYCSALIEVANQIKVLIIQHPLEQKHPYNTGRMAHLCLTNSDLIVAEHLSDETLDSILSVPSALLYPSLNWLPEVEQLNNSEQLASKLEQLIVIDSNWSKSKKMLHINPRLQALPRLSLQSHEKSNYQIRKSSLSESLSTIESITLALIQLENNQTYNQLLNPFDKMITLQQANKLTHL